MHSKIGLKKYILGMIEKAMWNIMFATYIGCQEGNQNSGKYVSIPILNV